MSSVMELCSSAMRGCIAAAPGKRMCVADLANIEGRVLAWLAGEEWLLKAFRDYDAGIGADQYKLTYARSFGVDVATVTKDQRQLGKVLTLAMGFSGGVGAFITMAATYNMDLQKVANAVFKIIHTIPKNVVDDANGFYDWSEKNNKTLGLDRQIFVACDILKRSWRNAHPNIVSFWKEIENGFRNALANPEVTFKVRSGKIRRDGSWLRIQTPSGRHLCYFMPAINENNQIVYQGVNPYTRKWESVTTYAGKLAENWTQFTARDVLAHNLPAIEAAGYAVTMLVHDEVLSEADDNDSFSGEHLAELMSIVPDWAEGLPLAAEGFTAYRYRK